MLFWHVGITIAFIRYAFRDEAMDLRFLAFGALLSDLIDTPIGVVAWDSFQTPRLWGHSFLFGTTVMMVVLLATRRGPIRKRWMLLATGVLLHLALDALWNQPATLWWPFLGFDFETTGFGTFGLYAADVLTDPLMWLGEAIGLAYLVVLWKKSGLENAEARSKLFATGVVSARIDGA
ncbi:MAG: metal-dependent hydrolase [Acidimicrobiia bacterium]